MTPRTHEQAVVQLQRMIPAPPQRVYRAWLDPQLLCRWMAPGGLEVTRAEVEERVGGHYRIWQGDTGGEAGGFDCELLELVPAERIVWRWGFVGPQRLDGPAFDSLLTITLREEQNGATALTLLHERLEDLYAAMPHVAESVAAGWEMVLSGLAVLLEEEA